MLSRFYFPGASNGKASAYNAGDLGSIPESGDLLEKEMVTHSSILAWKIPWTEEPGGLQSKGSQRVGHDRVTSLSLFHFKDCRSFSSKEQASFNFMAAVTICSDFGGQENKICHCSHCFSIYLPWSDGTGCYDLSFLNVGF